MLSSKYKTITSSSSGSEFSRIRFTLPLHLHHSREYKDEINKND